MLSRAWLRFVAVAFCIGNLCGVQDQPKFPYLGEAIGEKVNVRIKPNTTEGSKIVGAVVKGTKIGIVGEDGDFYKVLAPKGAKVWVSGKGVKYEGEMGEVTADQVAVLDDSRPAAEKLGTIPKGTQFKVVREHVGYYQIEAPSVVTLWIGKKYVKFVQNAAGMEELIGLVGGQIPVKPDGQKPATGDTAKPGEEDPAVLQKVKDAEQTVEVEKNKDQKEADYSVAIAALESARSMARLPQTKADIESKLKLVNTIQQTVKKLREGEPVTPPSDGKFSFTGWMDVNGPWSGYPGTHKILYGGKIVCFIKAKDDNPDLVRVMNTLYNNHVGVKGEVQDCAHPWDPYKIIIISEIGQIVPLTEAK